MPTPAKIVASEPRPFTISRTFDAPRDLVWKVHAEIEHLKHWWGPKGFTWAGGTLDLRPGGVFHYGLRSPDGQAIMWGKFVYREIVAPERLVFIVSFSDEKQGVTRHPMSPTWPRETLSRSTFATRGNQTELTIRWAPHNATEDEQTTFDAGHHGMRQGFAGTFDQLAAYLATLQNANLEE